MLNKANLDTQKNFQEELEYLIEKNSNVAAMNANSLIEKTQNMMENIHAYGQRKNKGEMYDFAILKAIVRSYEKTEQVDNLICFDTKARKFRLRERNSENKRLVLKRTDKLLRLVKYIQSEYMENKQLMSAYGMLEARANSIIRDISALKC